eukprot:scaffold93186_cov75-Phaeocystis_antarctica.AAC.2
MSNPIPRAMNVGRHPPLLPGLQRGPRWVQHRRLRPRTRQLRSLGMCGRERRLPPRGCFVTAAN